MKRSVTGTRGRTGENTRIRSIGSSVLCCALVAGEWAHCQDDQQWHDLTTEWQRLEQRWTEIEAMHDGVEETRRAAERSYLSCRDARTTKEMDDSIGQMEQIQKNANVQREAIETARRDLQKQRDALNVVRIRLNRDPSTGRYLERLLRQVWHPMRDLMGEHDKLLGWYKMYGDTLNRYSAGYEGIGRYCLDHPNDVNGLLKRIVAVSQSLAAVASSFLTLKIEVKRVVEG